MSTLTPLHIYIIQGLFALLVTVIGYILNKSINRITEAEVRMGKLLKRQEFKEFKDSDFTQHSDRIDKLRDKQEANTAEIYRHQDEKSDKIRDEINNLGESLRTEMSKTNTLILDLIARSGSN